MVLTSCGSFTSGGASSSGARVAIRPPMVASATFSECQGAPLCTGISTAWPELADAGMPGAPQSGLASLARLEHRWHRLIGHARALPAPRNANLPAARSAMMPGASTQLCLHFGLGVVVAGAVNSRRRQHTMARVRRKALPVDVPDSGNRDAVASNEGDDASEANREFDRQAASERVSRSMELLNQYSEEAHPGHQPGRFAGPGPEYDGMVHDGHRWHLAARDDEGGDPGTALAKLNEEDQLLVTKFEAEGGLALCLSNAFRLPDELRAEARQLIEEAKSGGSPTSTPASDDKNRGRLEATLNELGADSTIGRLDDAASPLQRAVVLMQAADLAEEREAVMRNVWSDVEFQAGDVGNAELVARLEMQFAQQLVSTAEARAKAQDASKDQHQSSRSNEEPEDETGVGSRQPQSSHERATEPPVDVVVSTDTATDGADLPSLEARPPQDSESTDGIFEVVLRGCANATDLAQRLPERELTATLAEPRNLGVALDLIGVYLKNYEIDKADLVVNRVMPLCRRRGGTWLVKGLDKLCAVRMKQFRAYDALVALREIEQVVPFSAEEGWEFHDILYRNLAWCYSSLDEAEKCLEYTRKSVEVKRACGVSATWFDIWDLGKSHARLGQKTKQREEMKVAYDLCVKAGDIHRVAEPSDRIMLAKILSNIGEVAMGVGDSYHLDGDDANSRVWYQKAEPSLLESYELHATALGPLKPLCGWAAGTVAHCMVRLGEWAKAREYLALALKVECTKDSTTPGSVIELIERVLSVHRELNDLKGMSAYVDDLELCLQGLRDRGWDRRERDVFALLLQKVATAFLLADESSGKMIPRALTVLKEAETSLAIFMGQTERGEVFQCPECGKRYPQKADLEAHVQRRHSGAGSLDGIDVAPKQFGPQANPVELLSQVRSSIRLLEIGQRAAESGKWEGMGDVPTQMGFPEEGIPGGRQSEVVANLGLNALGGLIEPEDIALSRSYALVGNWSDWKAFNALVRQDDGSALHTAEVPIPAGKDIEFQVICDSDWKQRMFPAEGQPVILGPSASGHGRNWKASASSTSAVLRVAFDPTGFRRLDWVLKPMSERGGEEAV